MEGCAPCLPGPAPPRPFRPGWGAVPPAHPLPAQGGGLHTLPLCPRHPGWGAVCPPGLSVPAGLSRRAASGRLPSLSRWFLQPCQQGPGWICNADHTGILAALLRTGPPRPVSPPGSESEAWGRLPDSSAGCERDRPGPTPPSVSRDGPQREARSAGRRGQGSSGHLWPLQGERVLAEPTCGGAHGGSRRGWGACSRSGHSAGLSPPLTPSTAVPGRPGRGGQGRDPTLSSASGAGGMRRLWARAVPTPRDGGRNVLSSSWSLEDGRFSGQAGIHRPGGGGDRGLAEPQFRF